MKKQILTLLVLLMTAVTGAWAQQETYVVKFEANGNSLTREVTLPHKFSCNYDSENDELDMIIKELYGIRGFDAEVAPTATGSNKVTTGKTGKSQWIQIDAPFYGTVTVNGKYKKYGNMSAEAFDYSLEISLPYTVNWDATTKTGTFTMPAYDVDLEVEYYPGMLTFAPNAIEGGTVEVVGLTDDALPAGFEKDAEGNIYVAEGTTFTLKAVPAEGYHFVCWSDDENNTNPEREITMPAQDLAFSATATFAENEYDITFSEGTNPDPENPEWTATPNPAKTKQTVTVTYTGTKKVIGVKAEKKAAVPTLKDALADGATVVINYTWDGANVTTFTYTNNGGNYTGNTTGFDAEYFNNGMSKDGTTLTFTASNPDYSDANVSIEFYTDTNEYFISKGSSFTSFTISVNGTDLTSQLKEVK